MMLVAVLIGTASALVVLVAGYLLGAMQGAKARERLREKTLAQEQERTSVHQRSEEPPEEEVPRLSRQDLEGVFTPLQRQVDALQRMLQPLIERTGEADPPRSAINKESSSQLQRERLEAALSNVDTGAGHQHDLTLLLNKAAELGEFRALVLSDDQGLTLAHSDSAWELDRIVSMSAFLLVLAERIGREGAPAPLSLMVHDEENNLILCRTFRVQGTRLLLTAVAAGAEMTPTALDPMLSQVDKILSG